LKEEKKRKEKVRGAMKIQTARHRSAEREKEGKRTFYNDLM